MLRLPRFQYHAPRSLTGALELASRHANEFMYIAGGTDLLPNMKHLLFEPPHLISLRGLRELDFIEVQGGGGIRIGALTTLTRIAESDLARRELPSLAQAAGLVAGPQIRNMGTLGGNVCLDTRCVYYNQTLFWRKALGYCLKKDGSQCHVVQSGKRCVAAHSADTVPALITLGAAVELQSPRGAREIRLEDFFSGDGVKNTVREADEIITAVRIPPQPRGRRANYTKVRIRNSIDFPILSIALAVDFREDGRTCDNVELVMTALGSKPRRIGNLHGVVEGRALTAEVIQAVAHQAHRQAHPLTNINVDPEWRREVAPVYVRRALERAVRAG
ncbi:MAG: 4-hydroxybenzoyl-CoA reductase subunit beta [Myxococcota bacterium]|nr:4-hydroxybenzoyl-CoA reductase subunit beta [Myxococcota bacterium]